MLLVNNSPLHLFLNVFLINFITCSSCDMTHLTYVMYRMQGITSQSHSNLHLFSHSNNQHALSPWQRLFLLMPRQPRIYRNKNAIKCVCLTDSRPTDFWVIGLHQRFSARGPSISKLPGSPQDDIFKIRSIKIN